MKKLINTLIAWLGGAALALLASAGGILDQFRSIEANLIICAVVATITFVVLGVLFMLPTETPQAYRTADRRTLERDVSRLRDQVPNAAIPGRRHRTYDRGHEFRTISEGVIAAATSAAVRDLTHGTTTLNPHQRNTRAHVLWLTSYEARKLAADAPTIQQAYRTHGA